MIYRFGSYELDVAAGELRRVGGERIDVQPKPLALLELLIRERARIVSADEILDALWPGVAVTPSSLTRAVSLARRAIGDTHRGDVIKSYARRGYRFCGETAELAGGGAGAGTQPGRSPAGDATDVSAGEPFVGRADALARLRAAWGEAARGLGHAVCVTGAAGIGKTRLTELFAAEVARSGALALVGRSREGEGVPAFWLWAQVLRQLVDRGEAGPDLRERAARSAELADLVPELAGAPVAERAGGSSEQSRFLLFDAVARALARASRRRPVLLVLEDLQWAGPASLRLLEHVVCEASSEAILVLATIRDEGRDRARALERTLALLRQQPRAAQLELRGFSRGEVATLVERLLGRPAPVDLSSELVARTAGVPLLVREAVRILSERGDLRHPERTRRWSVSIADRTLDLIRRPLERLSTEAGELVAAASVLGIEFPLTLAAAVADVPRERALDLFDEAEAAGVLTPAAEAPATWRFVHALFQEAAYAGLASGRRARLHLRAATELERRHRDDLDRVIAELAHHHHEALAVGDPDRAHACALRAAERATRLSAHEQAAAHYEQAVAALDHAESVDALQRLSTQLALGDALRAAGERTRRREVFADAIERARSLGRPRDVARAAIGFCDLSEWAARDDVGRLALEEARGGLDPGDVRGRAQVLMRLAYLTSREHPGAAEPVAREAVEVARKAGDPATLQDALYVLFFVLAGPDHLEERASIAGEVGALARASGASDPSLIAVLDAACDCVTVGDIAGARRGRELADELAGPEPHLGRLWHLRVFDAGFALMQGRFEEAERLAEGALQVGRRIEHPYARGVDRALRAMLARERGDEAEVLRIFDPNQSARLGPTQWVHTVVGRALAALGREAEARAFYEGILAGGVEGVPRNIRWHDTIVELAHLCADLGDERHAAALCEVLEPVDDHHGVLPIPICYAGPVRRARARLLARLGERALARELLEEALSACEALGARPTQARVLVELGALTSRGRDHLAQGLRLAEELGMRGLAAEARALLERA